MGYVAATAAAASVLASNSVVATLRRLPKSKKYYSLHALLLENHGARNLPVSWVREDLFFFFVCTTCSRHKQFLRILVLRSISLD
jgi:hypothetical protein